MTARARGRVARFVGIKPDPDNARALSEDHPAAIAGRTIFPGKVASTAASARFLISVVNNAKIGGRIEKGEWAGMPVYTLTLEERATCPRSCEQWLSCYGNSQHWPNRWDHRDPQFLPALEAEVITTGRLHRDGFVVRLHVLGDFYSPKYVLFWARMLMLVPALRVYGYTACRTDDADPNVRRTAEALKLLTDAMWSRFAVRTSTSSPGAARSRAIVVGADPHLPDVIVCPAATGKSEACSSCGLCWSPSARDKTIAFLQHGMTTRRGERTALQVVHPVQPPPRPVAVEGRAKPYETQTYPGILLAALKRLAGAGGAVTISLAKLAAETGIAHGSVHFVVADLINAGQISVQKNTRPGSRAPAPSTYRILGDRPKPPEPVLAPIPPAPTQVIIKKSAGPVSESALWEKVEAVAPKTPRPVIATDVPATPAPAPQPAPRVPAAFDLPMLPEEPTGPGIKSLLNLRACECHWPVGEPDPVQMYCADPTDPGAQYCDAHASMMFAGHRAAKRTPAGARL